ncbi:MAG: ABC transporter permease [Parcubacteria group bacterium]|nr:ABC transporter permease [Parcubacteria group bacterium]
MRLKHTLKIAGKSVAINRSRSVLTILGIVIGIASVIVIVSLGDGATALIKSQIEGIGSQTISIELGREPTTPTDVAQIFSDSLKPKDIELLEKKENVPGLAEIMPEVYGGVVGAYENETYRFTILGATDRLTRIMDLGEVSGDFLTEDSVKESASVAVLGSKVKDKLFGADDAIGKKVRVKGVNLRVIGVLPKKGSSSLFSFDDMVIVPYTTAQNYILGQKHFNQIIVLADTNIPFEETVRDVKTTLRESHGITDTAKDDFHIGTQADLLKRISTVTLALTLLLASVAGISLLVGGVGIMNIMFVSIIERTREIGLRKALGATNGNILAQFLAEAILLTFIGGAVGVLFGALVSYIFSIIINQATAINWEFSFPIKGAIVALGVSTFIGLVFGIYPARKAAQKNPIEALRYE